MDGWKWRLDWKELLGSLIEEVCEDDDSDGNEVKLRILFSLRLCFYTRIIFFFLDSRPLPVQHKPCLFS